MSEMTSHDLVHLGESALAHLLDPGFGSVVKKFREEMVKRDANGKFASKSALNAQLDALWMDPNNLQGIEWQLLNGSAKEVMRLTKQLGKKYDIPWREVETKHYDEIEAAVLKVLNDKAKQEAVSPSGTQRLELYTENKDLKSRVIPYSGPNPHASVTKRLKRETIESQRSVRDARTDDKPMFNPDYKLDTSQVQWRRRPSFRMSDLIGDNDENVLIHTELVGEEMVRELLDMPSREEVTDGDRRKT